MASTSDPRSRARPARSAQGNPEDPPAAALRQVSTGYSTIGGYRLRVLSSDCGLDGAPTLVMLHGFSDSADTWRPITRYLRHRANLIAVDLPGFGRSDTLRIARATPENPAPVYPELDRVVDAILDHATTAAPGPIVLIGNSLGGALTLRAAGRRDDVAAAIALAPANIGVRGWLGGSVLAGAKRVARLPLPHPFTRPLEIAVVAMMIPARPASMVGFRQGWMFSNHMGAARLRNQLAIARRVIAESSADFPATTARTPILLMVGDRDPSGHRRTRQGSQGGPRR